MIARNFFAELKRRNVYKVAAAYIVAGWALSQGIAQVLPVFDVPNWIIRFIVVLIIAGVPIALVLAWMFELTPEGFKRTADADRLPESSHKTYAWIYVVVIGALLSVSLFLLGRYGFREKTSGSAKPSAHSIVVLPFDNLSDDKQNAYFVEGTQDEILTRLAKISALKVISRTSTMRYNSHPENLRQIAVELGVANILEGTLTELMEKDDETADYQVAEAYGYRNDKDHAFEWLERAHRQRDAGLPGLRGDTLLANLHDDPRWDAFLRKMGLADDQLK